MSESPVRTRFVTSGLSCPGPRRRRRPRCPAPAAVPLSPATPCGSRSRTRCVTRCWRAVCSPGRSSRSSRSPSSTASPRRPSARPSSICPRRGCSTPTSTGASRSTQFSVDDYRGMVEARSLVVDGIFRQLGERGDSRTAAAPGAGVRTPPRPRRPPARPAPGTWTSSSATTCASGASSARSSATRYISDFLHRLRVQAWVFAVPYLRDGADDPELRRLAVERHTERPGGRRSTTRRRRRTVRDGHRRRVRRAIAGREALRWTPGAESAPGGRAQASVDLTVVVPAYNEEERLRPTLDAICAHLRGGAGPLGRLGADRRRRRLDRRHRRRRPGGRGRRAAHPARLRRPRNRGKGNALRLGVLASYGRRVLVTDADLATPIEELDRLDKQLAAEDSAAAIGSRAHPDSRIEVHQHRLREWLGRVGNRLIRAVAVPGIHDTQCGFKLFDGDRARAAFADSRLDGWGIDVEILRYFRRAGLAGRRGPGALVAPGGLQGPAAGLRQGAAGAASGCGRVPSGAADLAVTGLFLLAVRTPLQGPVGGPRPRLSRRLAAGPEPVGVVLRGHRRQCRASAQPPLHHPPGLSRRREPDGEHRHARASPSRSPPSRCSSGRPSPGRWCSPSGSPATADRLVLADRPAARTAPVGGRARRRPSPPSRRR